MAAISSSTLPPITDWSATNTVQVKFIPSVIPVETMDSVLINKEIEFQSKEIGIATNDSLENFFLRIRRTFGLVTSQEASLFIKNEGNLFATEHLSQFLWGSKKIVLRQESEVYFIIHAIPQTSLKNHKILQLPLTLPQVSMELRAEMQLFDFRHTMKFLKDDFHYINSNQLQLSIKNIYDLAQDNNNVVYRSKILEGFSSCQISLQFPESDIRKVKIKNLSEVLKLSDLNVIPKAVQNMIHSYLDYFPKLSLKDPSNLPQLFFKAIKLRFSYEGTRDEEEVISFFNSRYANIKLCIDKIVETQDSLDNEHLKEFLKEVKNQLSLFGISQLNIEYSDEEAIQELNFLLSNSTIFKALNTLIKKYAAINLNFKNFQ